MAYTYRDTPVGIHRLNKMPYDDQEVFYGVRSLLEYIKSGTAYVGQTCIVRILSDQNKPDSTYYEQKVTLKQGDGNKIIPVLELFPGYEFIHKNLNNHEYGLVYYYNGGKKFSNIKENIRSEDSLAWAMLPQASLIAGSDEKIDYLLETETYQYEFIQPNFVSNEVIIASGGVVAGIGSRATNKAYYPTSNGSIYIMPKKKEDILIKLWVQCDDYIKALEV